MLNNPKVPKLHAVRGACEPSDKEFYTRYSAMGGTQKWDRADHLVAIRVLSSLEDDLELEPRPENHKRIQAKAMQRVRRLLEYAVGDVCGKKVDVRKKFRLSDEWKGMS